MTKTQKVVIIYYLNKELSNKKQLLNISGINQEHINAEIKELEDIIEVVSCNAS